MKEMTTSFATRIWNKASLSKESKIFNDIYDALARVYRNDNVDLEAIMSVIVGLKEGHIKDNIGDLGSNSNVSACSFWKSLCSIWRNIYYIFNPLGDVSR